MARPVTVAVQLTAASANNIALVQTPLAAGNLTLNGSTVSGGVAVLDAPRRVLITSGGNDSNKTFTVYGNQRANGTGTNISQTITGGNATAVATDLDFGTVTQVSVSAATAGNVTVGTNTTGSSPWISVNNHAQPVNLTNAVTVSGTVTYSVQYTYDDPFWTTSSNYKANPTIWDDPLLTSLTAKADATFNDPVTAVRLTVTSGTGAATLVSTQAGIKG